MTTLADLENRGRACTKCELHVTRNRVVVYRGLGDPTNCRVLFIGEAPGADEDRIGVPFIGASGALLDAQLVRTPAAAPYGIVNLVLCRPVGNQLQPHQMEACAPFLDEKLRILRPERIVAVGRKPEGFLTARYTLFGGSLTFEDRRIPFHHVMHPSAVLHGTPRVAWEAAWDRLREWLGKT